MKIKLTMIILLIISIMVSLWLAKELVQTKQNYNRVKQSFADSGKELIQFRTRNGKLASQLDVLQFRNAEINKIFPEIIAEIKNLKIKNRLATQFSETIIQNQIEISTELQDTIIEDSIKVQVFDYKDEFYKIKGQIESDSINLQITSSDSIIQVVYKGSRNRPWLWILSKRKLEQVIYSKNPNSEIQYSRVIEIVK